MARRPAGGVHEPSYPRFVAAVGAVFAASGLALANWFPRIPETRTALALGYDELGLALFGLGAGAMVSMPLTGWLITRIGSRPIALVMGFALCVVLPLVALAPSLWLLAAVLLLFGAITGSLDVAMNAQAAYGEARHGQVVLSRLHGLFSAGALVGAVMGGAAASLGIPLSVHLAGVGVLLAVMVGATCAGLMPDRPEPASDASASPKLVWPHGPILLLGVVAFAGLLIEGAMADWSAVYLRDRFAAGPVLAAAGFALFSVTMTVGRLSGDWLTNRIGRTTQLVRGAGLLIVLGMALVIAAPAAPGSLAGFLLVGAGVSLVFPLMVRTASGLSVMGAGVGIAAVSTAGYTGLLAGPPAIGLLASLIGLRAALAVPLLLGVLIVLLAGRTTRER